MIMTNPNNLILQRIGLTKQDMIMFQLKGVLKVNKQPPNPSNPKKEPKRKKAE